MKKRALIIRADANPEIGSGHVMRCLALAEAWQDSGGKVCFVFATSSPALEERIIKEGFIVSHIGSKPGTLEDAVATAEIARNEGAGWIVVDGYHFGGGYQKEIKDCGFSLLVLDEYGHADYYYADIVLNQNISADLSLYPKHNPSTRFLLGTNYVLLRNEFLRWAGYQRVITPVARNVLVTLGGSDPENVTWTVIDILKSLDEKELEVIVVAGSLNSHLPQLREMVKLCPNFCIRSNVENMPELMAWADLAITAGGSTCWEIAFMRLPHLIIVIAENQVRIAEKLQGAGAARYAGEYNEISKEHLLHEISSFVCSGSHQNEPLIVGDGLVDGKGKYRVVAELMKQEEVCDL